MPRSRPTQADPRRPASLAGSSEAAEQALTLAGIDPTARGEVLTVADFARIAEGMPW